MSNDSFSEFSSQSWLSRLGGAIKGVLIGIVLFLISFPLLWWNEGRAVKTAKGLQEAGGSVVSVSRRQARSVARQEAGLRDGEGHDHRNRLRSPIRDFRKRDQAPPQRGHVPVDREGVLRDGQEVRRRDGEEDNLFLREGMVRQGDRFQEVQEARRPCESGNAIRHANGDCQPGHAGRDETVFRPEGPDERLRGGHLGRQEQGKTARGLQEASGIRAAIGSTCRTIPSNPPPIPRSPRSAI